MKKNHVQNVIIHMEGCPEPYHLWEKVSTFYASIVERKLLSSNLTLQQQIYVINKISEHLKLQESDHIIP